VPVVPGDLPGVGGSVGSSREWLTHFGAVTGSIGAITGITGSVLGVKAYRRAARDKAADLRLQLIRELEELRYDFDELLRLIPQAKLSHERALNAIGQFNSGRMSLFQTECTDAVNEVKLLAEQVSALAILTEPPDRHELEIRLVEAHGLRAQARQVKAKYHRVLAEDEKIRERIARLHERAR
jgi:hypothetical protein